jgi:hypothetical protein
MEQLQHLIVRRSCNNAVARQDVMYAWKKIQKEVQDAFDEMDKEHTVNGIKPQKLNAPKFQ